jgi:single-strand DNA-binding protein
VSATEVTVIGNVVDSPRRVRLQNGSVTNFRLAATERRFDRERQEWVDGGTFWSDVECWGELGGNVSQTISKGDPVVVVGTLTTRQWESETGRGSVSQIRAEAVGPNLARGIADFKRTPRVPAAQSAESGAAADPTDERSPEAGVIGVVGDYDEGSAALYEQDSDLDREPVHAYVLRAGRIGGETAWGGAGHGRPVPLANQTEGSAAQWLSTSTPWSVPARRTATR